MTDIVVNEVPDEQDIVETQNEVNTLSNVVDVAVEAFVDLTSIQNILNRAKTMNRVSARVTTLAVENNCNRLGIKMSNKIPSLENFDSIHTSELSTSIAIESIGTFLKETLNRIIKAFQSVITAIGEFFKRVLLNRKRNEEKDKYLEDRLKNMPKTRSGLPDIEDTAITEAFLIKNAENKYRIDHVMTIIDNGLKLAGMVEDLIPAMEGYRKEMDASMDYFESAMKKSDKVVVDEEKIVASINAFLREKIMPVYARHMGHTHNREGKDTYESGMLTHGNVFSVVFDFNPISHIAGIKMPGSDEYRSRVMIHASMRKALILISIGTVKMECPTIDELHKLIDHYGQLETTILKLLPGLQHQEKEIKDLLQRITAVRDKVESPGFESTEIRRALQAMVQEYRKFIEMQADIKGKLTTELMRIVNCSRRLCDHATKLYGNIQEVA